MKLSVTITVFILFLSVLGAYIYLIPDEEKNLGVQQTRASRLFDLAGGDSFTELKIENLQEGQIIQLEYRGDKWLMTEPFESSVDPMVVEGVLSAIRLSPKESEAEPEKGWPEYGLESPALKVGVMTSQKPTWKFLLLGDNSPVADKIFARWSDETTYFLLDARFKDVMTNSVYAFREKKVFRTPLKEITKLRFQSGLDAYEIILGLSGWVWMEPVTFLGDDVDPSTAVRMLAQVQNTYIKDFETKKLNLSEMGLESAENGVQIMVWADATADPEVLLIGKEALAKDAFYAKKSDDDIIFYIAQSHISNLFNLLSQEAEKAKTNLTTIDPAVSSSNVSAR